jgi:hypothetical protein
MPAPPVPGPPFSLPGTLRRQMRLEQHRVFPDGTLHHVYTITTGES